MNGMRRTCCGMLAGLLLTILPPAVAAAPPVDLELVTEAGFRLGGEREWIRALSDLPDVNIRVRTGQRGDRPEVKEKAGGGFHVVGVLSSRNNLLLPGGSFSLNDRRAIHNWLERLRNEGVGGLNAARGPFGLTAEQLNEAHEALKAPLEFATLDMSGTVFVQRVAARLRLPVDIDPAAARRLAGGSIRDELSKLSAGTALTLALRPFGLVLTVKRVGGATRLQIVESQEDQETWPIGFATERSPAAVHPMLFKYVPFEITDTPLSEALSAIQQRLELPLLYDHNALAREGIDPTAVRVNLPAGRTFYKRVLDKLLAQAKLSTELRIDEAGQPFLWISTFRDIGNLRQPRTE